LRTSNRRFASARSAPITPIVDRCRSTSTARACGASAVAVATGQHRAEELAEHRPALFFVDFADAERTVAALIRTSSPAVG